MADIESGEDAEEKAQPKGSSNNSLSTQNQDGGDEKERTIAKAALSIAELSRFCHTSAFASVIFGSSFLVGWSSWSYGLES